MVRESWRPLTETRKALKQGDLEQAVFAARHLARERGRVPLDLALEFLPVVIARRPRAYEAWALRWFKRWLKECWKASLEDVAEVAALLEELPLEPRMIERLRRYVP